MVLGNLFKCLEVVRCASWGKKFLDWSAAPTNFEIAAMSFRSFYFRVTRDLIFMFRGDILDQLYKRTLWDSIKARLNISFDEVKFFGVNV